jgi:hypothetical protein
MKKIFAILVGVLVSSSVYAHEMTPTYPKLRPSFMDDLYVTSMSMFNKRADVEYYEIGVFDKDFNPVNFVTSYRILNIPYLNKVNFEVYIRKSDRDKATYICSRSKLRKKDITRTTVASRICSKIK